MDPEGSGKGGWWRRGPQRTQFPLQREGPHRITVGATLRYVATCSDGDILLAVHLIDHGRRVGPKTSLKPPQLRSRSGIECEKVTIRLTAKDQATGRNRRTSAKAIRRLVLPDDFIRLAVDCRKRTAHRLARRRRLGAAALVLAAHELLSLRPLRA